jgi:hypothetical protein
MQVQVRPFRRSDRHQLTTLVNAHVIAVIPGVAVPVSAVLGQMEREPGEPIVDPWVEERLTVVAEQREAVVAAAHLLRYAGGDEVGADYRDAGEIRWLISNPDHGSAGRTVAGEATAVLDRWQVRRQYADGALPAPGCYGVPRCWPHISEILREVGFSHIGVTEVILVARVGDIARPELPGGITISRSVGVCGTRITAHRGAQEVGMVEVETDLTEAGTRARFAGWADIGNLHTAGALNGPVGRALLGAAADWLELGHVDRLLAYTAPDDEEMRFLTKAGFTELARTDRGWERGSLD